MRRDISIANLGAGRYDSEPAVLAYGGQEADLRWNASAGKWKGAPTIGMVKRGEWMIGALGPTAYPAWAYISQPSEAPGAIGQSSYTYNPTTIRDPDAGYDAGMIMEENLTVVFWNWDSGAVYRLATVYYPMDNGDSISTEISSTADDYVGVYLESGDGVRKFQTSGWVASAIDVPTKPILAPHLYMAWTTADGKDSRAYVEYVTSLWRWSGDPTP